MDHDRHLTKEDMQRENKHMKRCFMSDVIREMQIKMRYHLYGWTKSHIDHTKFWGEYGAIGTTVSLLWECKWCSHFERHFGNFSQN